MISQNDIEEVLSTIASPLPPPDIWGHAQRPEPLPLPRHQQLPHRHLPRHHRMTLLPTSSTLWCHCLRHHSVDATTYVIMLLMSCWCVIRSTDHHWPPLPVTTHVFYKFITQPSLSKFTCNYSLQLYTSLRFWTYYTTWVYECILS